MTACDRWCAGDRPGDRASTRGVARGRERGEQAPVVVVDTARRAAATRLRLPRRSASGSSESSRTRAGNVPSARPHTNTRSRSSPRPSDDVAHQHAVAEAADAPEVGAELELERAAEHVEAGRGLDGVEPGEPIERRLHLVGGPLLGLGPARGAGCRGRGTRARVGAPRRTARASSAPGRAPAASVSRSSATNDVERRAPRRARARTSRDVVHGRAPRAPRPASPPASAM